MKLNELPMDTDDFLRAARTAKKCLEGKVRLKSPFKVPLASPLALPWSPPGAAPEPRWLV